MSDTDPVVVDVPNEDNEDTAIRTEAKGKYVTAEVQDDEFEGTAV